MGLESRIELVAVDRSLPVYQAHRDAVSRTAAEYDRTSAAAAAAERQSRALADTTSRLTSVLGGLMAAFGAGQILSQIDQYTKFTAQLKLATTSTSEYATAMTDVRRISKEAQADLGSTGVLYARIANGTRELGVSQKKVAEITETVNLSLKVSGATFSESSSAMLQLSQAFASGTLRGEEFNAVNEAAPRVMKALADGIGVPVGALKSMATEGKITAEVMAAALPKALSELREEAKNVQTIGGAFVVLKNSVLEFIGTKAEANGTVSIISSGISTLADNLGLVAAAATGLAAAKLAEMIGSLGVAVAQGSIRTLEYAQAQTLQRTTAIASAQADIAAAVATGERAAMTQAAIVTSRQAVVSDLALANASISAATAQINAARAAGAQSFALAALAQGEAALVVAMQARGVAMAELAVLGTQQAGVATQITAANAALTASQTALASATAASGAASGLASRALGFLGGPIGAISVLLGIGVTAWMAWGNASKDGSEKAAQAVEKTSYEINADLEKQIEKLKSRNALAGQMPTLAKDASPAGDGAAVLKKRIDEAKQGIGEFKGMSQSLRELSLVDLNSELQRMAKNVEVFGKETKQLAATGKAATDLIEVRERLAGVNKQYLDDLTKLETARDKGAIGEKEYIKLVTQLATETYNKSKAGKEASKVGKEVNNEEERLAGLLAKTSGLTKQFADDWGLLNTAYKAGKITLVDLTGAQARLLEQQPAIKKANEEIEKAEKARQKVQADVTAQIDKWTIAAEAEAEQLDENTKLYGKSSESRKIVSAQIRIETDLQKFLAEQKKKGHVLSAEQLDDLTQEAEKRKLNMAAIMGENQALAGADQLREQNLRFGAENIYDDKERAKALLEIDANSWRERIRLAGEGTEAQKKLQGEYTTWYANQAMKPQLDETKKFYDAFVTTAHDTFISVANGTKDFATRLRETMKNVFFEWLWQMTAKKWIINIGASMTGSLTSGAASAAANGIAGGGGGGLLGLIGNGASAYNALSGIGMTAGNALVSAGSMFGSSALSAAGYASAVPGLTSFGAGSQAAMLAAQTAEFGAAGLASTAGAGATAAGAGGTGIMSGAASVLGSIPVVGWVALAAAAAAYFGGGKDRELTGVGLSGSLGTQNITRDVSWTKDGGWFNSDTAGTWKYNLANSSTVVDGRNYTDTASQAADKALLSTITKEYDALKLAAGDYAKALGVSADFLKDRTQDFSIELGTTAEEMQKNIAKLFEKVGNDISTDLLDRAGLANLKKDGETASQTVSRLAADISAVNDSMKVLGYETYKLNASGIKAAEGLVTLYGGLQQMQSITSAYYDNYYSDAEKATIATANIAAEFKKVGADMPASLGQLREWIEAAKALGTEAGDKTYVSLMQLTGAFASLNSATASLKDTATKTANSLADSKSDYILRTMEAQGLGKQAQNLQRQKDYIQLDDELKPYAANLNRALDEKEARELVTRQSGLMVQVLELEGNTVQAAALKHKLDIEATEEGLRPLAERIYQLKQEASAAEVAQRHRTLDIELMRALGNEEAALAAERADALKGLDEYSKGVTRQIWAANDAKAAIEKAKASAQAEAQRIQQELDQQRQAYESAKSAAESKLSAAYSRRASELNSLASAMESFGKQARDARESMIYGASSTLGPEAKYLRAKETLGSLESRAMSQDAGAISELQQFIELSRAYNASNGVFVSEFDRVQAILDKASKTAMSQADYARAQLGALNESVRGLIDIKDVTTDAGQEVVNAIRELTEVTRGNIYAKNAASAASGPNITTTAAPTPDQIYGGQPGEGAIQQRRMLALKEEAAKVETVTAYMERKLQEDLRAAQNGGVTNQYYMDLNDKYYTQAAFEKFARELGMYASSDNFTASRLPKFGRGGVFTNGIVSQPTEFNMAQMGEAGTEGIMPLAQGPKGLGVHVYGGGGSGNNKEAIELAKRQVTEAERNNDLLERQNELAEKQNELLELILTEGASTVDIRELKQYMGVALSQKARAPA